MLPVGARVRLPGTVPVSVAVKSYVPFAFTADGEMVVEVAYSPSTDNGYA